MAVFSSRLHEYRHYAGHADSDANQHLRSDRHFSKYLLYRGISRIPDLLRALVSSDNALRKRGYLPSRPASCMTTDRFYSCRRNLLSIFFAGLPDMIELLSNRRGPTTLLMATKQLSG